LEELVELRSEVREVKPSAVRHSTTSSGEVAVMFERIARALRRKREVLERIVLRDDGFDLYSGDHLKYQILWNEVDRIEVFKKDLITSDIVCMEFIVRAKNLIYPVNDEVEGFWDMVKRLRCCRPHARTGRPSL
jgi:hypothetical protein